MALNVLGTDLETCSLDPLTGYFRDGCCNTDEHDRGLHVVCARWCLCAMRWLEALAEGVAPPVVLESTHERALQVVTLEQLKASSLVH